MNQGQAITILPLKESRWCERCWEEKQRKVHTTYGVSFNNGPFEALCEDHMPDGALQEFWTQRLFQGLRDGRDDETMRHVLRQVLVLVQIKTAEECAKIADVIQQDARLAYSNKQIATGAELAAAKIADSIRTKEMSA